MVKIPNFFEVMGARAPLSHRMREAWAKPEAEAVFNELRQDRTLGVEDIFSIIEQLEGNALSPATRRLYNTRPKAADLWFRMSQRTRNDANITDIIRKGG